MKKIISIIVAVVIAFSLACCTVTPKEPDYEQYKDTLNYQIGMWIGIPQFFKQYDVNGRLVMQTALTDEQFKQQFEMIKQSGIGIATAGHGESGEEYSIRCLKAASEVGIKYIVTDNVMRLLAYQLKDKLDKKEITIDQAVQQIKEHSEKYTQYDSFYGYSIFDEPNISVMEDLGVAETVFKQALPDKIFYINLFPSWTPESILLGTYAEYIEAYTQNIATPYISYDHYPLKADAYGENYVTEDFLYNMDYIKRASGDRELWTFLQSIEYGASNRELKSKADAGFQAYSFLAYGGKNIQWFCYYSPPPFDGLTNFGDAMVDSLGNKTDTYSYVKTINDEILNFDNIFLKFDWKGIALSYGTKNTTDGLKNFGYIEGNAIKTDGMKLTSTEDTLTGVFKDGERDGYMVVNYMSPTSKGTNIVSMSFTDKTHAIVVENGVKRVAKLKKGKLELSMKAGEGCFVVAY